MVVAAAGWGGVGGEDFDLRDAHFFEGGRRVGGVEWSRSDWLCKER